MTGRRVLLAQASWRPAVKEEESASDAMRMQRCRCGCDCNSCSAIRHLTPSGTEVACRYSERVRCRLRLQQLAHVLCIASTPSVIQRHLLLCCIGARHLEWRRLFAACSSASAGGASRLGRPEAPAPACGRSGGGGSCGASGDAPRLPAFFSFLARFSSLLVSLASFFACFLASLACLSASTCPSHHAGYSKRCATA